MTSKLYDALLGTPVLLVAPSGSDVEDIPRTAGLGKSLSGNKIPGIADLLAGALNGKTSKPKNPQLHAWPQIIRGLDHI